MTIPAMRVPFVYVEFDSSRAFQGPAILRYQALLMGQKLATGTVAKEVVTRITSADQAGEYFGLGSQLHRMAIGWFTNNKVVDVYAVALEDDGVAKATGTVTFGSGPATANGTVPVYIAGVRIPVPVVSGEAITAIGDKLEALVNADTSLPVTAVNAGGVVTLTAKNAGLSGNEIDVRINYYDGEVVPAGITVAVVGMASGAVNPDVADIIAILGDEWYNIFVSAWNDATNIGKMEVELADRFGPIRMIDGICVTSIIGILADLETYGNLRNSPHICVPHSQLVPTYSPEFASAWAGQLALEGQSDPARPFQTLELKGILPPAVDERFTVAENDSLLYDGISTFYVDGGGKVRIQRAITTYQTNAQSAPDIAYLDVNTLLTLMYLRYDFRTYILTKYPRSKLADDGTNFGPGQKVITPATGKAEAVSKFRQWESLGLVENIDQFINDLVVERNQSDPNRMDWILPPDLINQFRVGGVTIQFLLQSPTV